MSRIKFNKNYYIMATPCSGKTTFWRKNRDLYHNFYEQDGHSLKLNEKTYIFFDRLPKNSVILGHAHEPNFDYCEYLSVILPMDILKQYIKERHKRNKNSRKKKRWDKIEEIQPQRDKLIEITERYNIKSFKSFERAMKYIKNGK